MYRYFADVGDIYERRLFSTPILNEIMRQFSGKIKGTNKYKFVAFSSHDTTLFPLISALNFSSWECLLENYRRNSTSALNCEDYPGFTSNIILELYKEGKEYYVQAMFNGKKMYLCDQKNYSCSFKEFSDRISNFTVSDYRGICNGTIPYLPEFSFLLNFFSSFIVFAVFLIGFL